MAKQEFKVWAWFSSASAYGDAYCRAMIVKARNAREALHSAHLSAFSEFGERWNDNGIDITLSDNPNSLGM